MRYKIFETSNGVKVMVMETDEFNSGFVRYYMQIQSSDWHFCVGCQENFDEVGQADADSIAEQYYDYVNDDERLVIEVAEEEMQFMLKE